MATTTQNYRLKKPAPDDFYTIEDQNSNMDIIDTELKRIEDSVPTTEDLTTIEQSITDIEENVTRIKQSIVTVDEKVTQHLAESKIKVAGGTANAIVLTIGNLTDGYATTFIASANNNTTATTINGKPLYKPTTTIAPNLTQGKAYTVWYSATSDAFFIKASAEGTAKSADVLAGKTFSNDDDTGLTGTIQSKGAQTYTPTTMNQTIAAGQYLSGVQTIQGDADLKATNIKSGVNIFGVTGSLIEGKQWQMGTAPGSNVSLKVTGLPFRPSFVLVWNEVYQMNPKSLYHKYVRAIDATYFTSDNGSVYTDYVTADGFFISDLGFRDYTYTWIAIA